MCNSKKKKQPAVEMAPLGNSALFLAEPTSAESVQIISAPKSVQEVCPLHHKPSVRKPKPDGPKYKLEIVWRNVFLFMFLHAVALYGFYTFLVYAKWKTLFFYWLFSGFCAFGVTAGAHRLWAHRTYKAKLPLRIFLMICQTAMLQNDLHEWVRDHRVHHKFTDSNADPHNASRGFFFSHIGWLLVKKHNDVKVKGKTVDMSDIESDPVVQFQRKIYVPMVALLTFILPSLIPWYYWNENWWVSWYSNAFRFTLSLHFTWLVNSAAHIWGTKPYDKTVNPTENKFVAWVAFGEGWHNYHHVFPWDYKAAELGNYRLNPSTAFLDFMAYLGLAYDLKTASADMVRKRVQRTGDGTWEGKMKRKKSVENDDHHHHQGELIWGWGDKDMPVDDVKDVKFFNKLSED